MDFLKSQYSLIFEYSYKLIVDLRIVLLKGIFQTHYSSSIYPSIEFKIRQIKISEILENCKFVRIEYFNFGLAFKNEISKKARIFIILFNKAVEADKTYKVVLTRISGVFHLRQFNEIFNVPLSPKLNKKL